MTLRHGLDRDSMFQASEAKETNRIEAFSDGVFAITLLALELKTPKHGEIGAGSELAGLLVRQWPSYMAFLFSFLTILVRWVNHHRMFRMLRKSDGWLMGANGLVLLLVTAVPLPTAVLAEHYLETGAAVAMAFYAWFYVMVNVAFNLLWFVAAYRRRLLRADVPDALVRAVRLRLLIGFPVYVAAVGPAFVSPAASLVICLLSWVHWVTLDRGFARQQETPHNTVHPTSVA